MTTIPATVNFKLYPYADFSETQTLKDSAGDPVNLTGYTALMHIRRERDDAAPLFTLTTADGSIVLGGVAGTIKLTIDFTDTASPTVDVDGEIWYHDILLRNTTADPDTVERTYQGVIVVSPGITRGVPPATP